MTDLTEQLRAGELYYVKKKNGEIVRRQAHLYSCLRTENAMPFVDFEDNDIEKVMAAVPSYNEVRALKELLKECRKELKPLWDEWLYDYGDKTGNNSARFLRIDNLLNRINNAI